MVVAAGRAPARGRGGRERLGGPAALDPADRGRQPDRRPGAGARRHRTAPPRARADDQGRHDPGDPPPGEEQPADGGRPAAAAGPSARAPEARAALDEAVRRVGSIALVHETLSHAPEEAVDFDDIADRVATMVGEVSAAEVGVIPKITGSFGELSAEVATPLAMVLTELLQNALQHGFSGPQAAREPGLIEVVVMREPDEADGDGRGHRRGPARGIRAGLGRPASACRSCAPWWWASSAGGCGSRPGRAAAPRRSWISPWRATSPTGNTVTRT